MSFEFPCPWCGADTKLRGSEQASWRFRLPCDLCDREMVVTWDGGLVVGRVGTGGALSRTDDATVRVRISRTG